MTDRLLRKHGKGIIGKQFATRRLADVMIDLFVLAAVLSRVTASIEKRGAEKAVALLNRSGNSAEISVPFAVIGISGTATVRDLWAHEDLGEYVDSFSANVPSHGVVMVRIVTTDGA